MCLCAQKIVTFKINRMRTEFFFSFFLILVWPSVFSSLRDWCLSETECMSVCFWFLSH